MRSLAPWVASTLLMDGMRTSTTGGFLMGATLLLGLAGVAGAVGTNMTGSYAGTLAVRAQTSDVAAALTDAGMTLSGTVVLGLADPALGGAYVVEGAHKGRRVRLVGTGPGGARLIVRGVLTADGVAGNARVRAAGRRAKGRLALARSVAGGDGSSCDAVYTQNQQFFTTQVMDAVLVPNCAACHVAGGQAEATRLRVVRGDPAATARTTTLVIDRTAPASSLLLRKPLGLVPHGGGQRLTDGSPQAQALGQWADLVAQSGCSAGTPPAGTGAEIYAASCAGCHGADAAGLAGAPDVRCTVKSRLVNAIRTGRGTVMSAFSTADLPDASVTKLADYLHGLCSGKAADLYASNCATCHGPTAGGGQNADGVVGPNIRCTGGEFGEALGGGEGGMPAFRAFSGAQVSALASYVDGLCSLGGGGGD